MENRLKRQRYWVQIGKSGRPVLSSLIARESQPNYGEWVEVNLRPCCTESTPVGTPSGTATIFTVKSNGDVFAVLRVASIVPATVVSTFNSSFPAFGTMTLENNTYVLKSYAAPGLSLTVAYS